MQVIAYIMKEYSMSLSVAQEYVTMIRDCVNPNPGFVKQLEEYNGILEARYVIMLQQFMMSEGCF